MNDPKAMSSYYAVTVYDTAPSDAPTSNPAFPEKHWRGHGTFQKWNGSETAPALEVFTVPAEQSDVNFPGIVPRYPKWTPNPTQAVGNIPGGLSSSTIAPWLATEDQAKAFAALIPGTAYIEAFTSNFQTIVYPANENRRVYELTYPNGQKDYAGQLIGREFEGGVGRPGHWDVASGVPLWVSDPLPTGAVAAGPQVAIPLDLKGGTLVSVMVGPGIFTVQVEQWVGAGFTITISGSGAAGIDGVYSVTKAGA